MRSPSVRRLIPTHAILAASAVALGCTHAPDTTWAPLLSRTQLAAMAPTLLPDSELQMQLPLFSIHQEVLPSGLRLGVETGETRGMVAVVTVVGSGSSADPPDHEGLAHLVEHLVYHAHAKGERPASDRLLRLGAQYNADTSVDATRYHEVGPASSLTKLLELAAERMLRPLAGVDEEDFERERAIVENEINQRNEMGVYGQVMSWMQTALLPPGHPHARPIGGNRASLRRLTLADARNFAAEHYRPSNAALLVTGEGAMTAETARVASRLPEAVTTRNAAAAAPARSLQTAAATFDAGHAHQQTRQPARPDTLKAAIALPEIFLAYDLGGGGYETAVAKILTAHAAEIAIRGRLLPDPDVLEVSLRGIEVAHRTWLECEIVVKADGRRQEIADKAKGLIWGLWLESGPESRTAWEWWPQNSVLNLRQAALADAIFDAEPFVERARDRASAFHAMGAVEAYDRVLATIAGVSPSDLSARALTLLAPERARTLFLEPLPEAQRPPPGPVGVPSNDNLPLTVTRQRASEMGAPPRAAPPAGLHDAKVMKLVNGLTVVLVPRRQFPSVTAVLGFHGGSAALPLGVLELVRIVEDQVGMNPSATKMESVQLDGPGFTADFVRTDRRRLSNALKLLAERLKSIAETSWDVLLSRAQAKARRIQTQTHDNPETVAAGRMQAALYGSHPYGRQLRREDMLELDPALAPQWLPRLYNPRNGVLVIVGDIDVEVVAWLVSGWFGDWQAKPGAGALTAPPVPPPGRRPTREKVLITSRPVVSQVEVTFACRLAAATTGRERAAQRVLAGVLGGQLTTEIREQAGAAYSVGSTATSLPAGGAHLTVAMSVDTRRLRDALRVLHAELDALAEGRIDKGTISQVRWTLAREDALDYQTGANTAGQILHAFMYGLPLATLVTDADDIDRVGEPDVARAFAPCVSSRVLSLVGDEATIRAAMGTPRP